jgi:Flp pilus assembly protein TadD/mono/diheme cytochrome c family protein
VYPRNFNRWLIAAVLPAMPVLAKAAPPTPVARPAQSNVTFYKNIAPILYEHCATCHRPGESGPFSLLTYQDAAKHAAQIARVTKQHFMPPWLPEKGHGDFQDEQRLTDAQIEIIQNWVKAGAPAGPSAAAPKAPQFPPDGWQLGKPDLVLHVAQPYHLSAAGNEVFWNFIMPVPITSPRWVRAIEVRPGNPKIFHHANVIVDRSGGSRRHEVTPGAGFPGMDLSVEEETYDPDGHFLSWKPGTAPVVEPEGMAWRADPGMSLVLNVHLRPSGKPETIEPEIGVYFTDQPQTQFPMLVQLEHDGIIDIPPGVKDFQVTDEFRVPMDLNVLAVYPHAHYLARLMEGYATLPDGTKKWLVRIPNWDLSWQAVFRLKSPMLLPKGTVVSMHYHYDNSAENVRNPNRPPKQVKGGNQAKDEMSHLWLQVLPASGGDRRPELQEALTTQRLEKYPDDFTANYMMGDLLLSKGETQKATQYFGKAASANPQSAVANTEYGIALFSEGKVPEAEKLFKQALEVDPGYTDARFDLASAQAASAEWEDSAGNFQRVLKERPDDPKAHQHLGEVLMLWGDSLLQNGKGEEALARYRDALPIRSMDPVLHGKIGAALAAMAKLDEAEVELRKALQIDPRSEPARQTMDVLQKMKAPAKP